MLTSIHDGKLTLHPTKGLPLTGVGVPVAVDVDVVEVVLTVVLDVVLEVDVVVAVVVVAVVVVPALFGAKHAETKEVSDQAPPLFVGVSVSS